jgi:hypothetical protein
MIFVGGKIYWTHAAETGAVGGAARGHPVGWKSR